MSFEPDLVVMEAEEPSPSLVVEVKLRESRSARDQLKAYMVSARCPIGLLVTRTRFAILLDRYTGTGPDSVAVVGEYDLGVPLVATSEAAPAQRGMALEAAVQEWLQGLREGAGWEHLDETAAAALREHVLPALQGRIRAAGPRALRWSPH